MRPIRLLTLCAAAVVIAGDALAADPFDDAVLRGTYGDRPAVQPRYVPGPPVRYPWDGWYFGAHAGYTNAGFDLGNATASLLDHLLRDTVVGQHVTAWTILESGSSSRVSYGGFIGKNIQLDDLVIGFEASYNVVSGGVGFSSIDTIGRSFNDDAGAPPNHHFIYNVTVGSNASARLTDYGTARVRAGVVLDNFLPYVFAGGAIGRVNVTRSATVAGVRVDVPDVVPPEDGGPIAPLPPAPFGPDSRGESRDGVIAYGYTAGLGLDIALMPNVFVRAEWEFIHFAPVMDVDIYVNTVRAGVGVKF